MNLFGIPIIISYDYYLEFLLNFSEFSGYTVFMDSPMLIPLYVFVNIAYLWFMLGIIIPFIYKAVIWFNNCVLHF